MTRLNYRTPSRSRGNEVTFSEFVVPLALLVIGLLVYGIGAFFVTDARSAGLVMGIVFVAAAIQTVLGILAAYATAILLKTSFGELRTAVLKLASIIVFSSAIAFILPMGGLLSLAVYFGLLLWLFGLEMYEAVVFAIIFAVIRMLVVSGVTAMFA